MKDTPKLTKASLRKAVEAARECNDPDEWRRIAEAALELIERPKPTPKPKRKRDPIDRTGAAIRETRKGVWPPPLMETAFADGTKHRMPVWQKAGATLPVERAVKIARRVYRDVMFREPPEVRSCRDATGEPRDGPYLCVTIEHLREHQRRAAMHKAGVPIAA